MSQSQTGTEHCTCSGKREYLPQSIDALQEFTSSDGAAVLSEVVHELRHRRTRRAIRLRAILGERIRVLNDGAGGDRSVDEGQNRDVSNGTQQRPESAELTPEQQKVVEADADAHLLITAGPGAGKTHVLTRRIASLVTRGGLAPGSEVLILTYSRAAVGEARRRIRGLGGPPAWTRAFTFDSFATRILREFDADGDWSSAGYDGRIKAATRLLRNDEEAAGLLSEIRHVLIDELQDVVGVRADFVLAVLDRIDGGWTLFGDPAQGIYNFQLDGDERRVGASRLYERLRTRFRSSVVEHTLTKNFRVETSEARAGLWAGPELNGSHPDYDSILRRLHTSRLRLHVAPPQSALPRMDGSVGILGPWNAHSLLVSRELWKAGIDHRVRRSATDRAVPAWVARVLRGVRGVTLGQQAFAALMAARPVDGVDAAEAWWMLRLLDPGSPKSPIKLDRVTRRIAVGDLPDDFSEPGEAHIIISTIHRSKGLEYDYVLIVANAEREPDDVQAGEEARLLYVAMTRARRELFQMTSVDTTRMFTLGDRQEGRWARRGYRKGQLLAFEVRPDDAEAEAPPTDVTGDRGAAEVQDYMAEHVVVGDELHVELSEPGSGRYHLRHGEVRVGSLDDAFSAALGRRIWGQPTNWPRQIAEIRVEGIDTVSGDAASARNAGLDGPPVWLRVRPQGLGELSFGRKEAP